MGAHAAKQPHPKYAKATYEVDNSLLKAQTRGLALRWSKNLEDRVRTGQSTSLIQWGTPVEGVEEGDGWLRTGSYYLPMMIDRCQVLKKLQVSHREFANGSSTRADAAEVPEAMWSKTQCFKLCNDHHVSLYRGNQAYARYFQTDIASSLVAYVDMLNSGKLFCQDPYCVVHLAREESYYVLYQKGMREDARNWFAIAKEEWASRATVAPDNGPPIWRGGSDREARSAEKRTQAAKIAPASRGGLCPCFEGVSHAKPTKANFAETFRNMKLKAAEIDAKATHLEERFKAHEEAKLEAFCGDDHSRSFLEPSVKRCAALVDRDRLSYLEAHIHELSAENNNLAVPSAGHHSIVQRGLSLDSGSTVVPGEINALEARRLLASQTLELEELRAAVAAAKASQTDGAQAQRRLQSELDAARTEHRAELAAARESHQRLEAEHAAALREEQERTREAAASAQEILAEEKRRHSRAEEEWKRRWREEEGEQRRLADAEERRQREAAEAQRSREEEERMKRWQEQDRQRQEKEELLRRQIEQAAEAKQQAAEAKRRFEEDERKRRRQEEERQRQEEQDRLRRQREEEAERRDAQRRESERLAAERRESERLAAERRESERLATQQRESERLAAERREAERLAVERRESERLAAERREAERRDAERRSAEMREAERRKREAELDLLQASLRSERDRSLPTSPTGGPLPASNFNRSPYVASPVRTREFDHGIPVLDRIKVHTPRDELPRHNEAFSWPTAISSGSSPPRATAYPPISTSSGLSSPSRAGGHHKPFLTSSSTTATVRSLSRGDAARDALRPTETNFSAPSSRSGSQSGKRTQINSLLADLDKLAGDLQSVFTPGRTTALTPSKPARPPSPGSISSSWPRSPSRHY